MPAKPGKKRAAKKAAKKKPAAKKAAAKKVQRRAGATGRARRRTGGAAGTGEVAAAPVASAGLDALFAALLAKQRAFCVAYLANGFNATAAAKEAGYSARTAESQGSRLLRNAKVAAYLASKTKKAFADREITAKRVLDEIAKLAFFDPRRLYNPYGSLLPVHELEPEVAAAIAGVDVRELFADGDRIGELKKVKFADKVKALELLGRYLKLFVDRVEHKADKEFVLTVRSILGGKA